MLELFCRLHQARCDQSHLEAETASGKVWSIFEEWVNFLEYSTNGLVGKAYPCDKPRWLGNKATTVDTQMQWFSNLCVHQNYREGLLQYRLLLPLPSPQNLWFITSGVGSWEFSFLAGSQGTLVLLVPACILRLTQLMVFKWTLAIYANRILTDISSFWFQDVNNFSPWYWLLLKIMGEMFSERQTFLPIWKVI